MATETLTIKGGAFDPHVHFREPGATHKEDFESGTKAALSGGIVAVLDMPNNIDPTVSPEKLEEKIKLAQGRIYTDLGFHYGSRGDNLNTFKDVASKVHGLKEYMNPTTGNLLVENTHILEEIFDTWPHDLPLLVHAEETTLDTAIELQRKVNRKMHVCHISKEDELKAITRAKTEGLDITCEVTPHHLFLNSELANVMKTGHGRMKPPLASEKDRLYLLDHIEEIDVLATDHAPHTKGEKEKFKEGDGPYGVPGIETSLILALQLYHQGQLSWKHLIEMVDTNPRQIFNIEKDSDTEVIIEMGKPYQINSSAFHSKAGWSPFEGMIVVSKIKEVTIRGKLAYKDGEFTSKPLGKII